MATTSYAIGLGSNRCHGRHGEPGQVIGAALAALADCGLLVTSASPVVRSAALGPGGRSYANAAAIVSTQLDPPALLALLKRIESDFGRRPARRWGARVLDLDILLWSRGKWMRRDLRIPHPHIATRRFVLDPLALIARDWRLPGGAFAIRHLAAYLARRAPVDRRRRPT